MKLRNFRFGRRTITVRDRTGVASIYSSRRAVEAFAPISSHATGPVVGVNEREIKLLYNAPTPLNIIIILYCIIV